MAQKKFVNQTSLTLSLILDVRAGDQPGPTLNNVDATLEPNSDQMISYGDANDPYLNGVNISGIGAGGVMLSDQIILDKSGTLDNEFNMNDTVYINLQGQNFVVTTGNTWTTNQ